MLETSEGDKWRLVLPDGSRRGVLKVGDTLVLRGWCERDSRRRIGFGERRLPALQS